MKAIIALLLILSLSSCVVGRWTYTYRGIVYVTTLTAEWPW